MDTISVNIDDFLKEISDLEKETPKKSNINWTDNLLLLRNELRVTPIADELEEPLMMSYLLFSEKQQAFYTPDLKKPCHYGDDYRLITKCSDRLIGIFCRVIHARMINGFKFSLAQIVAEWNYFAFALSMLRTFPEVIERTGKPSKEECRIVEKNVNFYDGDYKDNELMKVDYLDRRLQEINKLKNEVALLKNKLDEIEKAKSKKQDITTPAFCEIAVRYMNSTRNKKVDKREEVATSLKDIIAQLKLRVDDDILKAINNFDDENVVPNEIHNHVEVQAGGTNICHTDNVNNK